MDEYNTESKKLTRTYHYQKSRCKGTRMKAENYRIIQNFCVLYWYYKGLLESGNADPDVIAQPSAIIRAIEEGLNEAMPRDTEKVKVAMLRHMAVSNGEIYNYIPSREVVKRARNKAYFCIERRLLNR